MRHVNFTQQGGFPLRQETLDFLQKGVKEIIDAFVDQNNGKSRANHPALNVIVSGLNTETTEGGTEEDPYVSEGWVLMNEELLYFDGALLSDIESNGGIGVVKVTTDAEFEDMQTHGVYVYKYASGGGQNPVPINQFVRLKKQNKHRDIIKITTGIFVDTILAGNNRSVTFKHPSIEKGDLVLAELHDADQNTRLVYINARVKEPGKAIITFINLEAGDEVFGNEQIFDIRIIK